jgi:hypothetical protein
MSTVYIADRGTTDMWVSKDGGMGRWKHVPCYRLTAIVDFVVESADVVYAIDNNNCSKTSNGGASWGSEKSLDLSGGNGNMITLAPNGDILVGGTGGYVSFSKDGASTFTGILDKTDTANVWIVADKDYADNNILYIAGGDEVERGKADKNKTWSSRESDDMAGTVVGMTRYGSVIYVMTSDGTDSYLWRALDLKDADTGALARWSYALAEGEDYNRPVNAFKMSADYKTDQPKFWAIDTDDNELESWTDPLALNGPDLKAPKDGSIVKINPETGKAYDVSLTWERYSNKYIEKCELQIATDKNFDGIIYKQEFVGIDTDVISETIGPTGTSSTVTQTITSTTTIPAYTTTSTTGENVTYPASTQTTTKDETVNVYRQVSYNPGTTYYWRVKVSGLTAGKGDLISEWSDVGSFVIDADVPFALESPSQGATGVGLTPTFLWSEYPGAIGYEIMLSEDDPSFAIIEWSHSVDGAFYKSEDTLAYDTTYYWRVRGVTGPAPAKKAAPGGPWEVGVFTTMAEPPPPPEKPEPTVIVQEKPAPPAPPPQIVQVPVPEPAPIPSELLYVIIGIGAILIIALIVLIVRTRRVA